MTFDRPELLGLTVLLPGLVAVLVALRARRQRAVARQLADPDLLARIGGTGLTEFPWRRLTLLGLAAAAFAVAATGPRWGQRPIEGESSVLDVVVAVDISKSMFAEDLEPNRLERERVFLRRLVRELAGDRIGLVVFAGRAYVLSPLTTDHSAINLYNDALDPEMVSQGGSALSAAITQASDLARGAEEVGGDRAVVLISDGEALEEAVAVRDAAERAERAGVTIFTVGVGTDVGAPVPDINSAGQMAGYKRDTDGSIVVSKLDAGTLTEVAGITGGRFTRLDDANAVDRLASWLRDLDRRPGAGARAEQHERFAIFVALGLLLLIIDFLLLQRERGVRMSALWGSVTSTAGRTPVRATVPAPARNAAVAVLVLATLGFGIGDLERGNRLYREGRYAEAVAAYEMALRDGKRTSELLYNYGTALLRTGRYDEAQRALEGALAGVEPELRRRAHFNLGNRYLEDARNRDDARTQTELLDAAVEAYKRALRLDAMDTDAKWNLELALREREEAQQNMPQEPENQGEGGNNNSDPTGGGGAGQESGERQPTDPDEMSQEQADRILNAIEQDERQLTRDKLRKGERQTRVARDW